MATKKRSARGVENSSARGAQKRVTKSVRARPLKERTVGREPGGSHRDASVELFMQELDHPLKSELEAIRQLILGVSPEIREGIKWNSPSFRTTDWFATMNVHGRDGRPRIRLVLHTGANVKASATTGLKITDPSGLLKWLAKDRCLVEIDDAKDLRVKQGALRRILRAWVEQV
jgi:hypothetical protein